MHQMKMVGDDVVLTPHTNERNKLSITIYLLVTLFGVGSWVAMNGIWVELPNLVNELPEGWRLPSYLTVICQLANIGPIIYALLQKRYSNSQAKLLRFVVYASLIVGFIACIFLAIFWSYTVEIGTKSFSVPLLLLTFLLAIVDCTSSVTFLPFMSILPGIYMSPLFIGETLSGFLPSLVALAQGIETQSNDTNVNVTDVFWGFTKVKVGTGLNFPQEVFFAFLALMMLVCLFSFYCLNNLQKVRNHYVKYADLNEDKKNSDDGGNNGYPFQADGTITESHIACETVILLTLLVLLNTLQNGVLSSISSYAYAPFGSSTYHLAATLGSITSAMSCFLFLWFPFKSTKVIYFGTSSYTLFCIYLVVLATQSPHPWLQGTVAGNTVMVCVSIISGSLVSFTKLAITSVMRDYGRRHLFWAGVSNQIGSFLGAVVMFPIVNFTNIFSD